MKKSEIKRLLIRAQGWFSSFKLDQATESIWVETLEPLPLTFDEAGELLWSIRSSKEFLSVADLVQAYENRERAKKIRENAKVSIEKIEVLPLERLSDEILSKLKTLPETETHGDEISGRSYQRSTVSAIRIYEHFLKVKHPAAVKVVTFFSNKKASFSYALDGRVNV